MFFTSCVIISLIGGFSLNLAINSKKYRVGMKTTESTLQQQALSKVGVNNEVVLEDPVILATRALGWGTLYALIGTGAIGLTAVCIWKL